MSARVLEWLRLHLQQGAPIKVLSIRQPWASLITRGPKDVENRTWKSSFQGVVLIHAGKRWDDVTRADIAAWYGVEVPEPVDTGGIVGWARMTGYVTEHPTPWFNGPYGFVMEQRGALPFIPCRGRLGFFDAERAVLEQLLEAV